VAEHGRVGEEAELARERGKPLLIALGQRLPNAEARSEIAAQLASALAGERADEGEAAMIREAARLQEVGKIYVAEQLLAKPPAELTGAELETVRAHYEHGRALTRGAGIPNRACTWIMHARERWDGEGPAGLAGDEIPLGSRVIAVTREYLDAALLEPDAAADPRAAALARIGRLAGSALDPVLAGDAVRAAAG